MAGTPGYYVYKVVNKTSTKNVVNYGDEIARCSGSTSVTCTISRSADATVQVSASFGLTKGWVSGQLGITAGATVSTGVSCSAAVSSIKALVAYPYTTRYRYQIQKVVGPTGHVVDTSGYLYAFKPNKASAYCRIETK
ncbi:hypothetical protein [Microbacterium sp. 77mftsu3.1]|uniref:hypothetical protein n=1 Tax=Microbacterium sp. 77mftsu3.1 TaxID=1761802 RepID=UPI00037E09C2|nr:hypothetical protein [Microbacterium sp. 77mftsu3.1]SDH56310.1 hypothetical protein SAMN04488590_3587 [Microbacterium sp. 77mftsu3.1]